MKKNLLYVLMAAFAFTFTACSDDDDDPIYKPEELSKTFGVDEGTLLNLSYSGGQLVGKQVKFETANSRKGTLTLIDVVPGQPMMVIDNVELVEGANQKEYTFAGESPITRADVGSVKYDGSIRKDTLNLDVTVTFSDPNGWAGTYKLADYTENAATGAFYLNWEPSGEGTAAGSFPMMIKVMGDILLPQCLSTLEFQKDGNIRAVYNAGEIQLDTVLMPQLAMAAMMGQFPTVEQMRAFAPQTSQFKQSPANLIYWFENNGLLYVKLNIPAIVAQSMIEKGETEGSEAMIAVINQALNANPAELKGLLSQLTQMDFSKISDATFSMLLSAAKNGIPMSMTSANGHSYLGLTKEFFDPMMKVTGIDEEDNPVSDVIALCQMLSGSVPESMAMVMTVPLLISSSWEATTAFDLGLDLVKQ